MSRSQIQVLLALISAALLLPRVSGAPRAEGQPDVLQELSLEGKEVRETLILKISVLAQLNPARTNEHSGSPIPAPAQELSRITLLRLLSDLLRSENNVSPSSDKRGLAQEEIFRRWNSPRDRKAGCKNFFWKTFTSC
uniref:somatostatin-1-like n=1 Tax=Pristiophorus japonicus TaxID=55135 RepID=UPI00398E5D55